MPKKFGASLTQAQYDLARTFEHAGITTISQAVKAFERKESGKIDQWKKQLAAERAKKEPVVGQYWNHKKSGEVYAVQVKGKTVVSACGPLHYKEVTEENLSPVFLFHSDDPELVDELNECQEEYALHESRYEGE